LSDSTPFRCGAAARERGDPLSATAAPATGYLLVEHGGPWPKGALADLDDPAGPELAARARRMGARPLLIRRHGRTAATGAPAIFAFVNSETRQVSWGTYRDLGEILEHDWSQGFAMNQPIYLVCTHGRHDRCCAIAGRPVARELAELRPDHSWECSHLGGDRFAANVLVLPHSLYYGYVGPLDVGSVVAATERGDVRLSLLRGRSTDPAPVQAARAAAYEETGLRGIDAFTVMSSERVAPANWRITLAGSGLTLQVDVVAHRVPDQRFTCAHERPVTMVEHRAERVSALDA